MRATERSRELRMKASERSREVHDKATERSREVPRRAVDSFSQLLLTNLVARRNFEGRLQQKKSKSTLEALFRAARLANEMSLTRAQKKQRKGPPVRASHTALFPHIDLEGTRISTLAERVGISKQAVSELVEELDEMGVVERLPDPSDGRAKLVIFSKAGRRGLLRGLALLKEVESELATRFGKSKMLSLRQLLHELIPLLTESEEG